VRAELQTAREVAEQGLRLAQRTQDPALLMVAYRMVGIILQLLGEFATARTYLEQAIALYDPRQYRSQAFLQPQDHEVAALSYIADALWYLGYPDQALKRSQEALALPMSYLTLPVWLLP
jgi:tetratricopeptide (TPR) repeat protein